MLAPLIQEVKNHYAIVEDATTLHYGSGTCEFELEETLVHCPHCHEEHPDFYVDLKVGPHVLLFPCQVDPKEGIRLETRLSIVAMEELDANTSSFPSKSNSAKRILKFCIKSFETGYKTAPAVPLAGTKSVGYDMAKQEYQVILDIRCDKDNGQIRLFVRPNCLIIRCNGKECASKGRRWVRPSRSKGHTPWNLAFLFPPEIAAGMALFQMADEQAEQDNDAVTFEVFMQDNVNYFQCLALQENMASSNHKALIKLGKLEKMAWQQKNYRVLEKVERVRTLFAAPRFLALYKESIEIAPNLVIPESLALCDEKTLVFFLFCHLAKQEPNLSEEELVSRHIKYSTCPNLYFFIQGKNDMKSDLERVVKWSKH